jgi:hypothetical protein
MARIRHNNTAAKKKRSPKHAEPAPHPGDEPVAAESRPGSPPHPGNGADVISAAQLSPVFKSFADRTSQVVMQAASILEEEVAAGIRAAKQIENKFIDVEELRSGKPDEVLQRFRRDAHELVDIILDIVAAAAMNASRIAQRAISIRAGERVSERGGERGADEGQTPVLTMPLPVKAGETGEVSLAIDNNGDVAAEPFELRPTDLINALGGRIPAHAVQFDLKEISVAAHQHQRVVVRITPPAATPPGTYSGLIQSNRPDQLRAILTIVVV